MHGKLFFISGVSGVGKSSLIPHLKTLLPQEQFDIRDLDERGVPDGGGKAWHDAEVRHWIDVANENAKKGVSTVVCGFASPDVLKELQRENDVPVEVILLHAAKDVVHQRVLGRHQTPESVAEIERAAGKPLSDFAEDVSAYAEVFKKLCGEHDCPIIETDGKTPQLVAEEVAIIIKKALGEFRRHET